MPRPLFDHFGLLASFYDRVIHPSHPTYLLELLALEPGQQLLDVGGGTGRVRSEERRVGKGCRFGWSPYH